ncbi:MAG: class I SAM-dependent methyltransferase [Campylobacterales bacterium]
MNILDIDFNKLYIEQKSKSSFKPKTKKEWDSKASDMNSVVDGDSYIEKLMKIIDFSECKTLLDVGCGAGTVSINAKNLLESITAFDYSEEMIKKLKQRCQNGNISNITPLLHSWEQSWDSLPMCDIVVASRSMQVANMKEALLKLDSKAKKRVYLTTKVGGSFLPKEIMQLLQKEIEPNPDYIYIINILYTLGINPSLEYIELKSDRISKKSKDRFIDSIKWSIGELNEIELERLEEFYENKIDSLNPNIKWAVISWNK